MLNMTAGTASRRHWPAQRLSMWKSSCIASPKMSGGMKTYRMRWPLRCCHASSDGARCVCEKSLGAWRHATVKPTTRRTGVYGTAGAYRLSSHENASPSTTAQMGKTKTANACGRNT